MFNNFSNSYDLSGNDTTINNIPYFMNPNNKSYNDFVYTTVDGLPTCFYKGKKFTNEIDFSLDGSGKNNKPPEIDFSLDGSGKNNKPYKFIGGDGFTGKKFMPGVHKPINCDPCKFVYTGTIKTCTPMEIAEKYNLHNLDSSDNNIFFDNSEYNVPDLNESENKMLNTSGYEYNSQSDFNNINANFNYNNYYGDGDGYDYDSSTNPLNNNSFGNMPMNGMHMNGMHMNGMHMNGMHMNGMHMNGMHMNGMGGMGMPMMVNLGYMNNMIKQKSFDSMNQIPEIHTIHLENVLFGSDIYISTASEFGKQILRKNIESLKISLINDIDDEEELSEYIYGKRYMLTCGGSILNEGILTHCNIFPTRHIPFNKVTFQSIALIIYNVVETDIINDNSIKLKFTLNVSSNIYTQYIISLDSTNPFNSGHFGTEINWNTVELGNIPTQNKLRFIDGMCGQHYTNILGFSQKCLKKSVNIKLSNHINLTKINNDISHFTNNYSIGRSVMTISEKPNHIVMETIKFDNLKWCNANKPFYIPQCDTITNMCIIMHSNAKLLSANLDNIDLKYTIQDGIYKITNFDNFNHCLITSKTTSPRLYLIFNTVIAKISIQYDRCVTGSLLRKSMVVGKIDEVSIINLNSVQLV
jgi:hypothetical protein